VRSTSSVEFGSMALELAKHGRMVDGDATFPQEFFHATIAQQLSFPDPNSPITSSAVAAMPSFGRIVPMKNE
jgi:hypothetical protein